MSWRDRRPATANLREAARSAEKPLFGAFELLRIEFGRAQRDVHAGLRCIERDQRLVERLHDVVEHARRFGRLALQAAQQARKLRQRRVLAGEHVLRILDLGSDLFDSHHRGADVGEFGLFAGLRVEPDELGDRCPEIVGLARGGLNLGAVRAPTAARRRARAARPRRNCRPRRHGRQKRRAGRGVLTRRPARARRAGRGSRPARGRCRASA